MSMRRKFVDLCKQELISNKNSFLLLGDIGVGGFIDEDENLFERVFNMGIAEQALVNFGAGLSSVMPSGNVILHTISPFLLERAFEQIKLCCGYNQIKLILVSANGPFDYEKLGPTHHCPEDVNILSVIPGIKVMMPATIDDLSECFYHALESTDSVYIRMTSRSAELLTVPVIDEAWKKIYLLNGVIHNEEINSAMTAVLCIGESLQYCLANLKKGAYVVYWTLNPRNSVPESLKQFSKIKIFEPYNQPLLAIGLEKLAEVERKNFKVGYKKTIKKNLGWEDFDG